MTILLAENEKPQRELLAAELSRAHFEVFEAADGREALEVALKVRPEMALLDVAMPAMSGYEVCMKLRRHRLTRQMKIVLYTARNLVTDSLQAVEAGAEAFWGKPLPLAQLIQRLKSL